MGSTQTRARLIICMLCAVFVLAGCGKEPRVPSGSMDTPEHHYRTGMHFLDKKDPVRATQAFDKALELDPDYGPALAGKGLAKAMQGDDSASLDQIEDGEDEARTPDQELRSHIAKIRAYTALAAKGKMDAEELVEETEDVFDDAMDLVDDDPKLENPALYYYQGEAYLQALRFDRAEDMFDRTVRLNRGMEDQAKQRWELVQKVRRAEPESLIGKRIALMDEVSRADMAALLTEELGFERFFSRTQEIADGSFKSPDAVSQSSEVPSARDVSSHPLQQDIDIVISYGVRGLQPYPDGTFRPNQALSKAEVAMILEDIFARATNDPGLYTRFIGQASPFSDVRADLPYFNAVMLCTTRGVLDTGVRSGSFGPLSPVSGVDAVLAIRKLKSELPAF